MATPHSQQSKDHKVSGTRSKRPLCENCQRPIKRCLCDLVVPTDNRIPVLILQHPSEKDHPKGSVALLQHSLLKIDVRYGEVFEHLTQELNDSPFHDILLYPETQSDSLHPTPPPERSPQMQKPQRLILIDGSWKKAYKILQLNPCLQRLTRYQGPMPEQSQYTMRKAPKAGQLSTLEACCQALAQLEHSKTRYTGILNAFEEFNRRWQEHAKD